MLNEDKQALLDGTARIRCKLIVKATDTLPEIILTEQNSVKDWVYNDERYVPQQGFIGQFVARTLEGNLQNISDDFNIENRELELQLGIVRNTTETWYSMGNFIVTDPEDNEVKDNTKFQAMDYTKLFNKRFNGDYTDSVYTTSYNKLIETGSVTALWLAKYACAQVGIDFPQTSFTNSAFTINQNPFQAGESCRDVLKEISKLAYSWVRIGQDNKCYIDFNQVNDSSVDIHNVINKDTYYTLETKKTIYGPINNVVVGMAGVDGESHSIKDQASINQYGEHTIYIYDNPLTNTFELRELAQQQANKLFGLNYVHLEVETVGHPWLQGNERINVLDMEDENNFTYPFNKSLKYAGHIRSVINTMGESEVESTLAYESGFVKNIRNASLNVDKQNGKITALIEDIEENNGIIDEKINTISMTVNGTVSRVATVEKSVTDLEDDIDEKLGLISEDIDGVQINLDEFIDNEYTQGISNLQKQIDGAIQFWNGPEIPTLLNKPAVDWKTENERINHQADIYTVIEDVAGELKQGKSYRFDKVNGNWVWIELTDNELSAVQALAQEALDKAKKNEGEVVTLKSDVSDLKQTDKEITASVDSIENTLVPTADVSGSNIVVNDSTDASLVKFNIEGKSTQETRSGKNKMNSSKTPATLDGLTISADINYLYMNGTCTREGRFMFGSTILQPGTYTACLQLKSGTMPGRGFYPYVNGTWTHLGQILIYDSNNFKSSVTFTIDTATEITLGGYIGLNDVIDNAVIAYQIVSGSTPDYDFEGYGATPSPEIPSEIESVGYENLFDYKLMGTDKAVDYTYYKNLEMNTFFAIPIYVGVNVTVTASSNVPVASPSDIYLINNLNEYTSDNINVNTTRTITSNSDGYVYLAYITDRTYYNELKNGTYWVQVTKGTKQHPYIPYGKSVIEVKTVGKNLWGDLIWEYKTYNYFKLPKENTYYTLSIRLKDGVTLPSDLYFGFTEYGYYPSGISFKNKWLVSMGNINGSLGNNSFYYINNFKSNSILNYVSVFPAHYTNTLTNYFDIQLEESETFTSYTPYQENTSTIELNAPLRSLPNGVKDIAYTKNNKLYVDRYIGSVVLNGSETWYRLALTENKYYFQYAPSLNQQTTNGKNFICSYFKPKNSWSEQVVGMWFDRNMIITTVGSLDGTETLEEFKAWLSTHNTQVDYEFKTPVTEDYGEVDYPITYKNITNITTTDDLEPNMNITYVREGSMTDYIAGQFTEKDIVQSRKFSELSVKADGISASVTSVEGDLAETNGKVNSLETQITSQEATIKIVETHINKDDGTMVANEVITNGVTFNSDGLNIYVGENSYNTQINNIGTFYRDGDEIIGQTSKDGSILKNLKMQGQTQYSFDGDSYDFIEERVEVDGEYCYATFYNGEE